MTAEAGLATPSLRRRITWVTVGLIAAMLVVLAVVTDTVVESRLDGQLRQRLADRATVAEALVDQVDGRDLARRLEGDGVSVVVTSGGQVFAEGPLGGRAADGQADEGANTPGPGPAGGPAPPKPGTDPKATIVQDGDLLSITRTLAGGTEVELLADASDVRQTVTQVRLALLLAAGLVLVAAAVAVPPVVARTLRPLGRMTEVARDITDGDRARRLRPQSPATELGRTATAFDAMLDEVTGAEARAVASEERLRDFLSDAAHELRTPVTGVQAAAEHVLRDDPPREQREQALLGLVRESRRAGRLVDDLLTMARIDSGMELRREPVDLRAVVADVVVVRRQAGGATLEAHGPAVEVDADRDRVVQVVANLVDNALHAAGPGGTVRVETWADGTGAGVDVRDDGPGIPAADRERVFERLVRLDPARTSHRGGAGLGLPIARGIARAHGGDLVALEPGGPGAHLRLVLPAGRPA